ncbi:DUF4124 domain-containing protein [Dyella solisilvae]|uniref:DUF4124 domain-containing protein n=1 Tax=Dyella solisilvae TaxID=1920168 RepID=A0A370KEL8_9GAMM|nr:DUF4124 domain-containing protein [Dyella solisilvae]RDJ00551.1 DUF4124 domain-containing protein [Dyella solisilvae]
MIRPCALLLLVIASAPASAAITYQCTGADGRVSYQDKPCASGQRQQTLQLDESQPTIAPPPAPPPVRAVAEPAPPPPPAEPETPLPVMYTCISATDGKHYLSENGNPDPYQVPYGILGASQLPLSSVYGPPNSAGASAPELNRGRIRPGLIANNYVWVQDQCHALTYAETCHALRNAYDANETKLKRAFKSDRPPLEEREAQLLAQLRNC